MAAEMHKCWRRKKAQKERKRQIKGVGGNWLGWMDDAGEDESSGFAHWLLSAN